MIFGRQIIVVVIVIVVIIDIDIVFVIVTVITIVFITIVIIVIGDVVAAATYFSQALAACCCNSHSFLYIHKAEHLVLVWYFLILVGNNDRSSVAPLLSCNARA